MSRPETESESAFESLLDPIECPACGAEVEQDAERCPVCALRMDLVLAHDARPRVIRWLLDGVSLPVWAERRGWLWVWGLLYVLVLGVAPMADRLALHWGPMYWAALVVVVLVAVMSWIIAATEIAGDTGSSFAGGMVFVVSFFVWPVTAALAMVYLGRTLPRAAWRALQWANLACFLALAGVLIADFVAWVVR